MLALLLATAIAQTSPPSVEASTLRPQHTPTPALPEGLTLPGEAGTAVRCPVVVSISADGTPSDVDVSEVCPVGLQALADETVSTWRWFPPVAHGVNQAVQTTVMLTWTVPEPPGPTRSVAGLSPRQLVTLQEAHEIRPDGSEACVVRMAYDVDGALVRRTTNQEGCLVYAVDQPAPPEHILDDRRVCRVTLTSTAGRAEDLAVTGCPKRLKIWATAAVGAMRWIAPTDEPTPMRADIVVTSASR